MAETQMDRIARYIDDAIALEAASITALDDMAGDAIDPEEADMYRQHRMQSENQKLLLEKRLTELGHEHGRNPFKDMLNRLGAAATDLLHAAKDPEDKAARNLMQAYAMESLEVAVYEALAVAATADGDVATADLARQIQREEKDAAAKVMGRIAGASRVAATAGVS